MMIMTTIRALLLTATQWIIFPFLKFNFPLYHKCIPHLTDISYKQKAKAMFTPVYTNLLKNWEVHLLLCVFIDKYNNLFYILSVKPINLYSKLLNPICLSGGEQCPRSNFRTLAKSHRCVCLCTFSFCMVQAKG